MFKWKDSADDNKIKNYMDRLGIKSATQRAGVRQCLGTSMQYDIKRPSFKSCIAAIITEVHIAIS